MKKYIHYLFIGCLIAVFSCERKGDDPVDPDPVEPSISAEVALKWSAMTLRVLQDSPNKSPTYNSRALGYAGITMYESVVPGSIVFRSVATQLNGLTEVPEPDRENLDWEVCLSSGQKEIIGKLFPHMPESTKASLDSLHKAIVSSHASAGSEIIKLSEEYGREVANHIFDWSKTDGGHEGYNRVFASNDILPQGLAFWIPPKFGQSSVELPMHPDWGKNRTFVKENSNMPIPDMIEFSREPNSPYYKEIFTVYEKQISLTQAEREMAMWWSDDPGSTPSPPGHSYYLGSKLVKDKEVGLFEAASVFAKVGMAVGDAFTTCFRIKYHYFAERPTQYINRNIHGNYWQFWPEPPFPSFTSGHSTQSAAAATVLISVFGNNTPVTDDFHTGRPRDEGRGIDFKTRHFETIWATAEECGWSRILGGIHTPQDNINGLAEGKKVGEHIAALSWEK